MNQNSDISNSVINDVHDGTEQLLTAHAIHEKVIP